MSGMPCTGRLCQRAAAFDAAALAMFPSHNPDPCGLNGIRKVKMTVYLRLGDVSDALREVTMPASNRLCCRRCRHSRPHGNGR